MVVVDYVTLLQTQKKERLRVNNDKKEVVVGSSLF